MQGKDTRIFVPTDWINNPAEGLFAGQTLASGDVAPDGATAKRLLVLSGGDLYLVPPGKTATAGVLFKTAAVAGDVIDQQCDGIGTSSTCTVVAQFN